LYIIIIIIIIMLMKSQACFLFLDPEVEVGRSISSSVFLCFFFLLVDIVVLVLLFYLCPSSARVLATFPGIVLLPLLCSIYIYLFTVYVTPVPARAVCSVQRYTTAS
jgi:hypothetical protein